jgi:hypothetical protein
MDASTPIDGGKNGARKLVLGEALAEARRELVRQTLQRGPCSQAALAAFTGLDIMTVAQTLEQLQVRRQVRRLSRGRLERFDLRQGASSSW